MRVTLILAVAAVLYVAGAIAPAAHADPYYCDSPVPFFVVEDAAACAGSGGIIGRYWHHDGGHYDCVHFDAYNHYSWLVHDC